MTAAPAQSFALTQPVDSGAPAHPATAGVPKSFTNLFDAGSDRAARRRAGAAIDPEAFRLWFAPNFARYLRETFVSTEQVAVAFGVRHQTAINWWHGSNRASGDSVALALISFPAAVAWFLAEWQQ